MAEILELVVAFFAAWIYGTEDKPKHPIWRNSVRTIAFSGILVSTVGFLGFLGSFEFPIGIVLLWVFCSLIVISAEYYMGSKRICLAAFIAYPIWLTIAIATEAT